MSTEVSGATPLAGARPTFAHESEAELARILDFYAVRWEYEPHTFPILWNLDGEVLESFSPDFYLPDLDLYVELTTLRQRLVRKKNRKLRRLRELYPDVRVKLFYARDFRALMLKYGKLALVEGLSGAPGQVVPVRPREDDEEAGPMPTPAGGPGSAGVEAPAAAGRAAGTAAGGPAPAARALRRARRDRRNRRAARVAAVVTAGSAVTAGTIAAEETRETRA